MIAAGLGILICPRLATSFFLNIVVICRLNASIPAQHICTAQSRIAPMTVAHRRFQRVLTEVVGQYTSAVGQRQ